MYSSMFLLTGSIVAQRRTGRHSQVPHHMLAIHSKLHAAKQATKEGFHGSAPTHAML